MLSACRRKRRGGSFVGSGRRVLLRWSPCPLLVSHWKVNSEAGVKLVSRAFAEMRADKKVGRAEAMRCSTSIDRETWLPSAVTIESLLPRGNAAHPAYWAPFVVVVGDNSFLVR